MKNLMTIMAALLIVSGVFAQKRIIVKNTLAIDRKAEMVEVKAGKLLAGVINKHFILKNNSGKEIAYQLTYDHNKSLTGFIFQADVKAKSQSVYYISAGKPAPVKFMTSAQFVPERMDDFAWENDIAAYRMYGPALAKENASNGVDLWLKSVSDTVVAKRYRDELKHGITYHVDHGNGLDCYKVAHTLGAGGIAPLQDGKLFVGNNYNHQVITENGPLRSSFTLHYDKVKVGDEFVSQEITITTIAGSVLNKAVVKYKGNAKPYMLAGGIFTHDEKGEKYNNLKSGVIAYAEDAVSDAKVPVGRNYVGVFIPGKAKDILNQDNHLLISADYQTGAAFTYYFGGGWSKWKYSTDKDWFNAVEQFSKQIKNPLIVSVK